MEVVDLRRGLNVADEFVLAVADGKFRVTVFYREDAPAIVEFLQKNGCKDPDLLTESFWRNKEKTCSKRWKMRAIRNERARARGRYTFAFDLKKSMHCGGECGDGQRCTRVAISSFLLGGGGAVCRCA